MSEENVEVVRLMCDAYKHGDIERALEKLHPDVEWHGTTGGIDEGKVFRGHREVIAAFVETFEAWESQTLETTRFIDAGADRVVVFWHEVAKGRESGVEVETETAVIYTVKDGSVTRVDPYMDLPRRSKPWGCRSSCLDEKQRFGEFFRDSRRNSPMRVRTRGNPPLSMQRSGFRARTSMPAKGWS